MKKIFISHAHVDGALALSLLRLLESGIGLPHHQIFCTSSVSQGVTPGRNFTGQIQEELNQSTMALALISESFYSSAFCMCELGALWGRSHDFIPLLVPPITHTDMKAVISGLQAIEINIPKQLDSLCDHIVSKLQISNFSASRWNNGRNEFLKEFPRLYRASAKKRVRSQTFLDCYALDIGKFLLDVYSSVYLIVIDIDRQNQINARHGIKVGDWVIDAVADLFASYRGSLIEPGRCGDDTFIGLFAGADIDALSITEELLEKIRTIPEQLNIDGLWVTASAGICELKKDSILTSWKTNAYEALLAAQQKGGNTVAIGEPAASSMPLTKYRWGS